MSLLRGQRVYVDANRFIYLSEKHPVFGPVAFELFRAAFDGVCTLVTSDLTLAEVLVLPLKLGNDDLQAKYIEALAPRDYLEVWAISRSILMESAKLRGSSAVPLPDAIHIATAQSAGCTFFVSEDRRIRVPAGVSLTRMSELRTLLGSDVK